MTTMGKFWAGLEPLAHASAKTHRRRLELGSLAVSRFDLPHDTGSASLLGTGDTDLGPDVLTMIVGAGGTLLDKCTQMEK